MSPVEQPSTTPDLQRDHCPARGRASCTFRNSSAATGSGGVSQGLAPAPGGTGEVRHQGVPGSEAATEGGPQPEGEPHAAAPRTRPRLRQSVHRDQVRSVRLTRDELDAVTRAAEASGLKTAGFLATPPSSSPKPKAVPRRGCWISAAGW